MKYITPAQFAQWKTLYSAILANDASALQLALQALSNDPANLIYLIDCNELPPTPQEEKPRPLLLQVVSKGNQSMVDMLLAAGAEVNICCLEDEWTALCTALKNHHIALAYHLIERGADIHAKTKRDTRVMDFAISAGDLALVKWLHQQGCDFAHINKSGTNSLHYAAESGRVEMVQLVQENTDFTAGLANQYGRRPVEWSGSLEVLRYLHECEPSLPLNIADPDNGKTSIMEFACQGETAMVLFMLELGVYLQAKTADQTTLLHYAALAANGADLVRELVVRGADVNVSNKAKNKAIHWAVKGGCLDSVKLLAEAGRKNSAQYSALLYLAVKRRHEEIAHYLIDLGADVNVVVDDYGHTPLMAACENDDLPLIQCLLDHGAQPGGAHYKGRDPLFISLGEVVSAQAASLLIQAGADVNERDRLGSTVLHRQVERLNPNHPKWRMYPEIWQRRVEAIRVIVKAGGDPRQRDDRFNTVLSYAEHPDVKAALYVPDEDD